MLDVMFTSAYTGLNPFNFTGIALQPLVNN
jgi:hypothetical protein